MRNPTREEIDARCGLRPELTMRCISLVLVADTREQAPYQFEQYDCELAHASLPTGDYSIAGLEGHAAIERKSLDDLISCLMGDGRKRFERELARLRGYDMAAVVIEASMEDVRQHNYRSKMQPHAVLQSILAFQVRYGVPFTWAGSREGGEYCTYWALSKFMREAEMKYRVLFSNYGRTSGK